MIIPSITLQAGAVVGFIGGKPVTLDAGEPEALAKRLAIAGEVTLLDADSAKGDGSNAGLIERLVKLVPCRVGGGIRDLATAVKWLDKGATKIILGTAAKPELLGKLPKERLIAALEVHEAHLSSEALAHHFERMRELMPYVSGFLVSFMATKGLMQGFELEVASLFLKAAGQTRVTFSGGIASAETIARLDRLGADAQVGMALYTGKLDLADAIVASMRSDRADGLWPTVIVDEHERAMGLVYSSLESVREAVKTKRGAYYSRSRQEIWFKGESSGDNQELLHISCNCDRDALRFMVRQRGDGFCHQHTWTCWGPDKGVPSLARRLRNRVGIAPEGSYTRRVLEDPKLLRAKLIEEARELGAARGTDQVVWEAADVMYFTLVAMARAGVPLEDIEEELDRRALKVVRRRGDTKLRELLEVDDEG